MHRGIKTINKKFILAIAVVAAVVASALIVLLQGEPEEAISVVEFEEFHETYFYIDANGDASGLYVALVTPSELANHLKTIIALVGTDEIKKSYIESIRSSLAMFGLEARNLSCEITGFGAEDNFKITLRWETPKIARWKDDRWTITSNWVDNQSAAKEIMAGEESAWIQVRTIAELYDIQVALYKRSYMSALILPKSAENIYSPLLGSSQTIDYGGGTHSESSLYLGQIDGKPAIIENGFSVTATENEITITPEHLLENSLLYTINYSGIPPENATFIGSLDHVRLDLKYGRELDDDYSIYSGGSWYSLSPAQVLYYSAEAITTIDQGGQFSILQPIESVAPPDKEDGDWGASWENLSKNEYVALAQTIRENIKFTGEAPGTIETSIGKIRFTDALFTFTRILSSYWKSGELPNMLTFVPVPSGVLTQDDKRIPANLAYFLLPDTYVNTGTSMVNEVLDNIYEASYDNRKFAEEICNWTGTNITYGLSYTTPTSEEVMVSKKGQCRDYTNVYLALNRTARMPARRVRGWVVSAWQPPAGWEFTIGTTPEGKTIASHAWAQVYLPDEGWVPVEPQSRRPDLYVGKLPYEVYRQSEQTWMSALAAYETARGLI